MIVFLECEKCGLCPTEWQNFHGPEQAAAIAQKHNEHCYHCGGDLRLCRRDDENTILYARVYFHRAMRHLDAGDAARRNDPIRATHYTAAQQNLRFCRNRIFNDLLKARL